MRILGLLTIILFSISFSHSVYASTISGGNYTLNGGPTAISTAQSSGGVYTEQSTADPASGNASGGVYAATPAPAAPATQTSSSQTTTAPTTPTANTPTAFSGGVSGQIVMEELPGANSSSSASGATSTISNTGSPSAGVLGIAVTNVRLVRGTPTSITVHLTTSVSGIGSLRYSPSVGEVTTLTDSAPSTDHTFTINNLDPSLSYQIQIAAVSSSGASSGVYELTASPEQVGEVGSSVTPSLIAYHPTAKNASSTATSTKETSSILHALPPYIYELLVLILAIIIGIVWVRSRRSL
jgi:hypothetical protein